MDKQYTYTKDQPKKNQVVLTIKIDKEKFKDTKAIIYKQQAASVDVKGFRPGKAPQAVVESKLGPDLYENTLNKLLPEITMLIMQEEKYEPITQVKYDVKKVSDDEGVEYEATFVVYPEIKLGDFKKIEVKDEDIKVTKEEVEAEEKKLIDVYVQRLEQEKKKEEGDKKTGDEDKNEKKEEKKDEVKRPEELTDEIVKSLGIGFDNLEKLREQIKQQLEHQKVHTNDDKKINTMIEEAIKKSKIEAPEILVEEELTRREADYKARIEQLGLKLEDFMKTQNTTIEDLKKLWKDEAEKKINTELLLFEIVKTKDIQVIDEEISKELDMITDPKLKEEYSTPSGKRYIGSILLQQKAIEWMKEQVKGDFHKHEDHN